MSSVAHPNHRCPGTSRAVSRRRMAPVAGHSDEGPIAIIEMSRAAGRSLMPHPHGDDPVRADTAGVGHLLLAARAAGARRIVVGCGGSATSDGGLGSSVWSPRPRPSPGSNSPWPAT